jgi:hypothetical protein
MSRVKTPATILLALVVYLPATSVGLLSAQTADTSSTRAAPSPPPATKLEAFQPVAGAVTTLGYDELGLISSSMTVNSSLRVDVRQMQDAQGSAVRGIVVEIKESDGLYRVARSFVDEDELPELIKGIDALLTVKANPTSFKFFEVKYRTRGDLVLAVFNNNFGRIAYTVTAGRVFTESRPVNESELRRLRDWFEAARQKLDSIKAS